MSFEDEHGLGVKHKQKKSTPRSKALKTKIKHSKAYIKGEEKGFQSDMNRQWGRADE